MKVLIVFAHPEPQSLNGSLYQVTINELKSQGHQVRTSDLYAMKWKSEIDRADFPSYPVDARLRPAFASAEAYASNTLTDDVKAEQEKLLWADTVIFHFPLWWYSMPAILKGWFERVYSLGFAYGKGEYNEKHWGDRYGEGLFVNKRAMLVVTVGSWPEHYSARGIAGPIDDVLYPVNHGLLFYAGFQVLPSHVVYRADKMAETTFEREAEALREKLRALETTKTISYRAQNAGDYEIPTLTLKPGLEGDSTATGFSLHIDKSN
ncbi:hypothetical protein FSARC_3986 [Fusarium sarcochroum]|uniref:Flavodoxin-like fold domain-containing protein n=1 Tax=Fusarium sarcochroum TaxID=1208366 RepID=A0A8H4U2J4_9HYPO|nr:hypothetical protein FSARC_3986 [Fusarium sarcochroum]